MTPWDLIRQFITDLFAFDQAHPLLFTQFYFWAFFALVFAGFSLLQNKVLLRNAYLFAASLFFYYKTSGLFVLLLLFVVVYNYFAGRRMASRKTAGARRAILTLSVLVDLSTLVYFKYAYFFTDFVNQLFGTSFGVYDVFAAAGNALTGTEAFRVDSIFLPVGISFFTFQAISYVVDIHRRRIEPVRGFLDFGFYLTFFPQLVAGPIVRASEFISQLHHPYRLSRRWFGIAVFWIMNGLVKKLVLSDYIAVNLCDRVFENPLLYSGFENLSALFCYSLQVYADFSGYTDIATGVAMLMGFWLPKNFNSPYKATNAGQFWKRWHMTLSNWLKDYVYIPLGGNRNGTVGTWLCIFGFIGVAVFLSGSIWVAAVAGGIALVVALFALFKPSSRRKIVTNVNSMDTMLLGGLWHGASWNFVIWGGLNGIGMIIYKFWNKMTPALRFFVTAAICGGLYALRIYAPAPVWNLFFVWMLITCVGTLPGLVRSIFRAPAVEFDGKGAGPWIARAWAVFQTFVFITFTRLFFRSGSNLDPAEANEVAWNTAKNMVAQIGSAWDLSKVPAMMAQHAPVLLLFVFGMLIHWLPERFKRRYRLAFARLPLAVMALVVVAIILFFYQFITADLQSFIYFQF